MIMITPRTTSTDSMRLRTGAGGWLTRSVVEQQAGGALDLGVARQVETFQRR